MPFADYKDMKDCMAKNQDKGDPAAYCATIMREAEKRFTVAKLDEDKHEVYGWASVSVNAGDRVVVDYQDDIIEPAELERAAHEYVRESGLANAMHQGEPVGKLIESLVITPEKLTAMGLMRTSAPQVGWWVGFKVAPDSFAKVKGGDYRMFSIEGTADAVEA